MKTSAALLTSTVLLLSACAGRAPQPIATSQPQDVNSTCAMVNAEIEANNVKIKELGEEQGIKVVQNVAAGAAGLIVWPMFFAMDFQGSAGKDLAALQARQQYLAALAIEKCQKKRR